MKLTLRIIGISAVCAAVGTGCARRAPEKSPAPAPKASVPLPDWAPENPSPEFMRAAKVLRPYAEESAPQEELSRRALHTLYNRTLTAAWEFFGTLSDEQIKRFLAVKELWLPFKSLTEKQRAALDHYFDVYRDVMKDVTDPEYGGEHLVQLYKFGAKEDLSNVEIQFLLRASGIVAMLIRVRQPDGSFSPPVPTGLGRI